MFILWKEFCSQARLFAPLRFVNKVIIDLKLPFFCTKIKYYSAIELLTVSVEQNENLPSTRGFKIFQIFYKVSLFLQAFKMMTRRGEKKLWRVERSLRPLLVEKNRNANSEHI